MDANKIESHVIMVAPTLGQWQGRYYVKDDLVEVHTAVEGEQAETLTSPRTRFMTKKYPVDVVTGQAWKTIFDGIVQRKNRILERFSIPVPIRGVRVVPKAAGEEFFRLTIGDGSGEPSIRQQWHDAATRFSNQLEEVYAQIRERTPKSIWEAVRYKLPQTPEQMRQKFYFALYPIEFPSADTPVRITGEELSQYRHLVQQQCQEMVDRTLGAVFARPRQELAAALRQFDELVRRGGRVTMRSVRPLQEAVRKFRMFEFVADKELIAKIDKLQGDLQVTDADDLRDEAYVSGLASAVRSVAEAAMASVHDADDLLGTSSRHFL